MQSKAFSAPTALVATAIACSGCSTGISTLSGSTAALKTPPPTFSPASGNYLSAQTVTISDANATASIYYTTDGSAATANSTRYTHPVAVASTQTIHAIALAADENTPTSSSADYIIRGVWAWMSGNTVPFSPGIYGVPGVAAPLINPGNRIVPSTWTDNSGNLWLFGGETQSGLTRVSLNDLWEYTPSTGFWTWRGGSITPNAPSSYGTLGHPGATNFPGARYSALTWKDSSGRFWLFGGSTLDTNLDAEPLGDLWVYDPSTLQWTWMGGSTSVSAPAVYGTKGVAAAANFPGGRFGAVTWADKQGNLWLFGGDETFTHTQDGYIYLNDLWKYSITTGQWTWVSGGQASNTYAVYGTKGVPAAANQPGSTDEGAVGWIDSEGSLWLFGGSLANRNSTHGAASNSLWRYQPSSGLWTWMNGSDDSTLGPLGVYGALGVPASTNTPGGRTYALTWTDAAGMLWMYGGDGFTDTGFANTLSDLWQFNPVTDQWTWINGSNQLGQPVLFGPLGVPSTSSNPGSRMLFAGWADPSGALWLFGGFTFPPNVDPNNSQNEAIYNDLWRYYPATTEQPAPEPTFSPAGGNYLTPQTVTLSDSNPTASIFYTTDGSIPTVGSTRYTGPITVSADLTVRAIAAVTGYMNSLPNSASYIIQPALPGLAAPAISPAGGTYTTTQNVTITDSNAAATIFYTIDGTVPTSASTQYTGPFVVPTTQTVQAIAIETGYADSAITTASFTINLASGDWTWMSGGTTNAVSTFGTLGVPSAGNAPGSRTGTATWTDNNGNLWLFGGTHESDDSYYGSFTYLNDLWEYSRASGLWTWRGGSSSANAPGDYGNRGISGEIAFPGARTRAVTWKDSAGRFWLYGGFGWDATGGEDILGDLWMFDPSTMKWTWMKGSFSAGPTAVYGTQGIASASNTPGSRSDAVSWADTQGNLWLYGGTYNNSPSSTQAMNDLWQYSIATNQWTWVGGSNTANVVAVYGSKGVAAPSNQPGNLMQGGVNWIGNDGSLWLFGGYALNPSGMSGFYSNALWRYQPSNGLWTWMSGSNTPFPPDVYGTQGVASSTSVPGGRVYPAAWQDAKGNFWLYGGAGYDSQATAGALSDLWQFDPSTNQWTWVSGSNLVSQPASYGTLGVPGASNTPGARDMSGTWTDPNGALWFFSGSEPSTSALPPIINWPNDLWRYHP